jgi:hypothetical protein
MPITKTEATSLAAALSQAVKSGKSGKLCRLPDGPVVRVAGVEVVDVEGRRKVLAREKASFEAQLAVMPQFKSKPEQETLDFWNMRTPQWGQPIEDRLAQVIRELADLEVM